MRHESYPGAPIPLPEVLQDLRHYASLPGARVTALDYTVTRLPGDRRRRVFSLTLEGPATAFEPATRPEPRPRRPGPARGRLRRSIPRPRRPS